MTSVLSQAVYTRSLTSMQKTSDQLMDLCQYPVTTHVKHRGQNIRTDAHSLCLEISFKESILHNIKQEVQQGSFITTKKGGNNLQSYNQRQEQHRVTIFLQMPQPRAFLPRLPLHPGVTESHGKGCPGPLRLWLPTQKKLLPSPSVGSAAGFSARSVDKQYS